MLADLCRTKIKDKRSAGPGNTLVELAKYDPTILWYRLNEVINKCLLKSHNVPGDVNWHVLPQDCGNYYGTRKYSSSVRRLYGKT